MLKRPCKFYNTTGKCAFGKHCKFSHDKEISNKAAAESHVQYEALKQSTNNTASDTTLISTTHCGNNNHESLSSSDHTVVEAGILDFPKPVTKKDDNGSLSQEKVPNKPLCHFFAKKKYCHFGKRCRFSHERYLPAKTGSGQEKNDEEVKEQELQTINDGKTDDTLQDKVQDEGQTFGGSNDKPAKSILEQRVPKVCNFFKQGYCRYGRSCRFYHPKDPKQLEQKPSNLEEKEENPAPIDDGFRQVVRKPRVINVYTRQDVDDDKQSELRLTELQQLKRRFPTDKVKTLEETVDKAIYVFTFLPTDPDWPFDVKAFDIKVEFPVDYPLQLFQVSLPMEQDLPATVRRYIEVSLQEWTKNKQKENLEKGICELYFRPFLRWMDRNMENMVTEGLRQLRRELTAQAAGLQFISATELKKEVQTEQANDSCDPGPEEFDTKDTRRPIAYRKGNAVEEKYEVPQKYSGDEGSVSGSSDDNSEEEDGADTEGKAVHQRPAVAADTERRGTELAFRNMQIWYCTTIMVEKLWISVQCERCKNTTDFATPPNRVNSVPCGKCNNSQLVVFRPVLAHSYSSTFGYLDLDGCSAFDVILQNCHLSMGCIMCSRDILVKKFCPGKLLDIFCRNCHNKMQFAADSVKCQVITSAGVDANKFSGRIHLVATKKAIRSNKDPAIQLGKPLPNNGACKHYKKSYRWLRFPCCGKCYPCDVCHDEKEDHEMKFANRMICGFCCKEQVFSVEKPCSGCSSSLTKVHTTHWEGGKGCRNKITMSRNDEKKYTNMSKTVSNKAKATADKSKGKKNTKLRHT